MKTTASFRSWKTLFADSVLRRRPRRPRGVEHRLGALEEQQRERARVGDRDRDGRVGGHHDGGDEHARDGGAGRLLERGPDRPLEPVRREELLRRQDARQDRAVGGEEEARAGAEHERDDRSGAGS